MSAQELADRRIRAFHEVGHCWGLWHLRRRFRYTTLRPRTSGFDALTVLYRRWEFDEEYPLAVAAVCGPIAEFIYRDSISPDRSPETEASHLQELVDGAHDDFAKCRLLLQDPEKLAELGSAIRAHWNGVSLVAEDLLEQSTLSGSHVFEILDNTVATNS